jgi:hypothetical protein
MEHVGQVDVVDEAALAAHEPDVFLALHSSEPDRVASSARRNFRDTHCAAPSGWCAAAHWTALMMLS